MLAWFKTCHFQVTPEIDRALMVRGFFRFRCYPNLNHARAEHLPSQAERQVHHRVVSLRGVGGRDADQAGRFARPFGRVSRSGREDDGPGEARQGNGTGQHEHAPPPATAPSNPLSDGGISAANQVRTRPPPPERPKGTVRSVPESREPRSRWPDGTPTCSLPRTASHCSPAVPCCGWRQARSLPAWSDVS
jgi:hypothetical protein